MIEDVEEHVGEELAGQIPDGKPAGPERREEIVSGEPGRRSLVLEHPGAALDDPREYL